ncbi:MAG: hypothetical protein PF961_19080 [Planctomycetota bacterium]|jgi:hypothetical protein|nr:hypothetical protein [Planctomycetota bacterium]
MDTVTLEIAALFNGNTQALKYGLVEFFAFGEHGLPWSVGWHCGRKVACNQIQSRYRGRQRYDEDRRVSTIIPGHVVNFRGLTAAHISLLAPRLYKIVKSL